MFRTAVGILLALSAAAQPVRVRTQQRVLTLDMEEYVAAVVSGEAGGITEIEALKAMAVAARSYAAAFRGRHAAEGFDFCETTHCQDARLGSPAQRILDAVEAVHGQRLWYQGRVARAFYHQDCGGHTAPASELWPDMAAPYLTSVDDTAWHAAAPWETRLDLRALGRVAIRRRGATGRVAEVAVDGRPMTGESFQIMVGRALGWNRLRSLLFEVDGDIFRGAGSGHGAGLCQRGAQARARAGKSWREILAAYYPGARPGVTPQGLEWRRSGTERLDVYSLGPPPSWDFDRAAAEAERLAGWTFRQRPRVRIFPTRDAFRDATGEPGFVAASTRGHEVRIRADQAAALTHELIHVLLNQRARRPIPLWLEEGLALCLSTPGVPARGNEADTAFLDAPKSESELRRGYEGARARVSRLLREQGLQKTLAALDR